MYSLAGGIIHCEVLTLCEVNEYLCQFIRRIVIEMDGLGKAALQTRIGINEVMHLVCISCHDTDELSTVVLQSFQQRVYCLTAKGVIIS